jgi:tetratricopeptide (TPR) repeat protein
MMKIILLVVLLGAGLWIWWGRRAQRVIASVMDAYRRADHAGVLRAAEGLRAYSNLQPDYHFYRAKALYELGDLEAAEQSMRTSMALRQDRQRLALANDALGEILLEQGRYDEAIESFEQSITYWPTRGCCHRAVAAAHLRSGGSLEEALERARTAARLDESAAAGTQEIHNMNLAEDLATLAWALAAASGNAAEVSQLVTRSLSLCPETTRPVRAQLHYHSARAYAALGNAESCARHLERTIAMDADGTFGRLARRFMSETAAS